MRIFRFITHRINNCKQKTIDGIEILWDNVFKGGMFALIVASITWLSIFLYVVFYYLYIPSLTHNRPVHLEFKPCGDERGICSYPSAHIRLTKKQYLLMVGQPYNVLLSLEMPESPANVNLGMFMVCAQMNDKDGKLVSHSCRSTMLHYRSWLLKIITTFVYSPFYIIGSREEIQTLEIELYTDYEDVQNHAVTDIFVEIQTQHIELYKAKLNIQARLSGLRYLMFHWPLSSAFLGISSNLFLIIFIASLSWWHLYGQHEYDYHPFFEMLTKLFPSRKGLKPFTGDVEEIGTRASLIKVETRRFSDPSEESDSDPSQSFFKQVTGEELGEFLETESES